MALDFDLFQQMIDANKSKADKDVAARFYDRAVKTDALDENGLPVFKNVCFVEIRVRDSYDVFDQPATADKIKRFPTEYNRYLLSKKQIEKGAPLEQFAFLSAAEVESLKYRGIFTVEALSELSDEKAQDLGVVRERALAIKFLDNAKANAKINLWQKKEEFYLSEIARLKEQIAQLKKRKTTSGSKKQ